MSETAPARDPDAAPWWEGVAKGELRYQMCKGCEEVVFFPRSVCPNCLSDRLDWRVSKGQGTIYALTIVHRAPGKRFAADVPYAVVLVDLDEGFRMLSRLTESGPGIGVGSRVKVVFKPDEREGLPWFEPAQD